MSSQVPADCCIEQFALALAGSHLRCLGRPASRICRLWKSRSSRTVAKVSVSINFASGWPRRNSGAGDGTSDHSFRWLRAERSVSRNSSAPLGVLQWLLARQLSARDIEKTIYVDRHGCMKESADQCRLLPRASTL